MYVLLNFDSLSCPVPHLPQFEAAMEHRSLGKREIFNTSQHGFVTNHLYADYCLFATDPDGGGAQALQPVRKASYAQERLDENSEGMWSCAQAPNLE